MDHAPHQGPDGPSPPILFEARLTPYRSLPPAAFTILMLAVIAVAFLAGAVSVAFGAWPVSGFCGVELLLESMPRVRLEIRPRKQRSPFDDRRRGQRVGGRIRCMTPRQ